MERVQSDEYELYVWWRNILQDQIPTFDELKRHAAALPPRFTVDPSSLPSVGDVSDDDDGGEVAVFAKTDFDTLE